MEKDKATVVAYELGTRGLHGIVQALTNDTPMGKAFLNNFHFAEGRFFVFLPVGLTSDELDVLADTRYTTWPVQSPSCKLTQEMPRTDFEMAKVLRHVLGKQTNLVAMVEDIAVSKKEFLHYQEKISRLESSDTLQAKLIMQGMTGWRDCWFHGDWVYYFISADKANLLFHSYVSWGRVTPSGSQNT